MIINKVQTFQKYFEINLLKRLNAHFTLWVGQDLHQGSMVGEENVSQLAVGHQLLDILLHRTHVMKCKLGYKENQEKIYSKTIKFESESEK